MKGRKYGKYLLKTQGLSGHPGVYGIKFHKKFQKYFKPY